MSTPYHLEGNAPVERAHQTFVACLFKLAGDKKSTWPRYVHPTLFAIRVTVFRSTGYLPFFVLYGQTPVFSLDIDEQTWQTLDWDKVSTHEELIAIRARQILRRDEKLKEAIDVLRKSRRRAIDDRAKRQHHQFDFSDYEEGMYVWLRDSKLDEIKGGKGEWMYRGPYIIHKKLERDTFILQELSGAVMHSSVNVRRLLLFFFRRNNQTLKTDLKVPPNLDISVINPALSITASMSFRMVYGF